MIDEIRREIAQTYLVEGVHAIVFAGCFGLIVFALYVFAS